MSPLIGSPWGLLGRRRRRRATPPVAERLLVISDIHLGEDILKGGPSHLADYIRALNLHLTQFIAHHRQAEGRWHLVVNGDMFDFVKVSVAPSGDDVGDVGGASLAALAGDEVPLDNTPDNVVYKLGRILEIHRPLFREMGRFMASGHRVTIIEGNHDAEFYFPKVRERLREELVRLSRPADDQEASDIAARLAFRPWFLAEPNGYHIEHGHQYDEYCSFEYNLAPLADKASGALATPLSHRPMPYFAELLGDFSTHDVNQWSFARAFAFLRALGAANVWLLVRLYVRVGVRLLSEATGERRRRRHLWRSRHEDELVAMGGRGAYGLAILRRLDRLKAPPAEWATAKMLHLFMFDRLLVLAAAALAAPWAVATAGWRGLMLVVCATAATLISLAFAHRQEIGQVLRRAAGRVADATGARLVVFGHSHQPERVDLRARFGVGRFGRRPVYLNTGSWVTREILRGESGRGMTYVLVEGDRARLLRWLGPDRPPREVAAS